MSEPTREERHAEARAWAAELVLELDAREARDRAEAADDLDHRARAILAHRLLKAALDLDLKARAHAKRVLDEAERVRAELARADVAWRQAEAISRALLPDLGYDESELGIAP